MPNFISGIKFNYSLHKKFWSYYKTIPISKERVIASIYEVKDNNVICHSGFSLEEVISIRNARNNCLACQYAQEHINYIVENRKKYFNWPTRLCNYCPLECGNGAYECLNGIHSNLIDAIRELENPKSNQERKNGLIVLVNDYLDRIINAKILPEVEII